MRLEDYLFHFSSIWRTRCYLSPMSSYFPQLKHKRRWFACWAWQRHRSDQASPFKRIFPSLLLGFFTLSTFLVASIFSSRVAASSSVEVLVSSLNCGFLFKRGYIYSPDFASADFAYLHTWIKSSHNYAQSCYGNNTFTKDRTVYTWQSLLFNITTGIDSMSVPRSRHDLPK